jgi:hypothetical protein
MKYDLSQHAKDALAERQIPAEWIERAIDAPQRTEPDRFDSKLIHFLAIIPEYGNRVLRVVLNPLATPARVVTAYYDRKMKGKL